MSAALQAITDGPEGPPVRPPHTDVMKAPSPVGALPLARHADLDIYEHALQKYLLRYLAGDGMKREEACSNLPHVENELATMLGALHAANVPDYIVRAVAVARELNFRIKTSKLDQADAATP
ncbi:MAG: hypothetical protein NT105_23740 [Verrucomicrobia bacterium]|nr:hypothetical protein [Verrucomicrobiota bacterium]